MDKLDLAWDTFHFYTSECHKQEDKYQLLVGTINNFFKDNRIPTRHQRKRLINKFLQNIDFLFVLYKKQSDALDDIISLCRDNEDIPIDKEVDIANLLSLKNVTITLMHELNRQKNEYKEFLS